MKIDNPSAECLKQSLPHDAHISRKADQLNPCLMATLDNPRLVLLLRRVIFGREYERGNIHRVGDFDSACRRPIAYKQSNLGRNFSRRGSFGYCFKVGAVTAGKDSYLMTCCH